jgi:hypothetical protein
MQLTCEIEARVRVLANATDNVKALADIYATQGNRVETKDEDVRLCRAVDRVKVCELVRGTVLIGENAPGVGTVIATQVHPAIGEWRNENGQGRIEGVAETRVLYIPGGSDIPAAAEAELPFNLTVPQALNDESLIDIQVLSAEANALMSDRLEMKLQLSVTCETRQRTDVEIVTEIAEGAPVQRRPGIVINWPLPGETAWDLGKRYGIPADDVGEVEAGQLLLSRPRRLPPDSRLRPAEEVHRPLRQAPGHALSLHADHRHTSCRDRPCPFSHRCARRIASIAALASSSRPPSAVTVTRSPCRTPRRISRISCVSRALSPPRTRVSTVSG